MAVDMSLMEHLASEFTCQDKSVIIEEGSRGDWLYVLLEGYAKVKKRTPKGMVIIDTLKPGDIFGEIAFLEGETASRSATVVAAEGPVRVGILDKESLARQYNEMSPRLRALTRSLATKLRETTSKLCSTLVAQE
jgi:CRP/FNR family transcriptional regulator, cyclic AMP receptor protein